MGSATDRPIPPEDSGQADEEAPVVKLVNRILSSALKAGGQ